MFELDVELSSDGQAVVIHDYKLDRTTTGSGSVADHPAQQLRALDAGSWFSPAYRGQHVPLFSDVLEWMNTREGIELLLEFKGEWDPAPVSTVIEQVEAAGLADRTVGQSFSQHTVQALADVAPGLRRGLLIAALEDSTFSTCARLQVGQLNPHGLIVRDHPDLLGRIRDAGMAALVWTANEPADWAALIELGADGIITDRPDALRGFLAARGR